MKIYKVLFLFIISTYVHSQTDSKRLPITGDIKNDIINLLPEGKIKVDILGIKAKPRQIELTKKFQESVRNNREWFIEYMKSIPNGEPMPYHPKLGLTESEYSEFQNLSKDIELVTLDNSAITIQKNGDLIEFNADENLAILKTIKVDLAKEIITIGDIKITSFEKIDITNDKNGLKSKWKGYKWRLEEPKDLDMSALKDMQNLNVKLYEFTIGRLDKNGKTIMTIKAREIVNGTQPVNYLTSITF